MDPQAVTIPLHAAIQYCVRVELTTNRAQISGLPFELERGCARHNAKSAHAGERPDQFTGKAVAVILTVAAHAQVREREYEKRSDR